MDIGLVDQLNAQIKELESWYGQLFFPHDGPENERVDFFNNYQGHDTFQTVSSVSGWFIISAFLFYSFKKIGTLLLPFLAFAQSVCKSSNTS
jgi:hypothetical protein